MEPKSKKYEYFLYRILSYYLKFEQILILSSGGNLVTR